MFPADYTDTRRAFMGGFIDHWKLVVEVFYASAKK
jgi:hypothetical protein